MNLQKTIKNRKVKAWNQDELVTNKIPPFYSNTPDNTHCFQAAFKIVLGHFMPEREFSFEELDTISDKVLGKWTWPQAGLLALIEMGFNLEMIDPFDYERFLVEKVDYLKDEYGEEIAREQETNSDIDSALKHIERLLSKDIQIHKKSDIDLLREYVNRGYLLICNVNLAKLNNQEGYIGHFVVIYSMDNNYVEFHDPGLPARKSRRETIEKFNEAWQVSKDAYALKK